METGAKVTIFAITKNYCKKFITIYYKFIFCEKNIKTGIFQVKKAFFQVNGAKKRMKGIIKK